MLKSSDQNKIKTVKNLAQGSTPTKFELHTMLNNEPISNLNSSKSSEEW